MKSFFVFKRCCIEILFSSFDKKIPHTDFLSRDSVLIHILYDMVRCMFDEDAKRVANFFLSSINTMQRCVDVEFRVVVISPQKRSDSERCRAYIFNDTCRAFVEIPPERPGFSSTYVHYIHSIIISIMICVEYNYTYALFRFMMIAFRRSRAALLDILYPLLKKFSLSLELDDEGMSERKVKEKLKRNDFCIRYIQARVFKPSNFPHRTIITKLLL